jgi:hypothetical protein
MTTLPRQESTRSLSTCHSTISVGGSDRSDDFAGSNFGVVGGQSGEHTPADEHKSGEEAVDSCLFRGLPGRSLTTANVSFVDLGLLASVVLTTKICYEWS